MGGVAHWFLPTRKRVGFHLECTVTRGYERKDDPKGPARQSGKVGSGDNAAFRGYINVPLSDEQKRAHDEWASSASMWERFSDEVAAGVNISVKREPGKGSFLASATQRDPASPNAGLVITARAKDAPTALTRLLFILTVLSRSPRWEDTQPLADPDRW